MKKMVATMQKSTAIFLAILLATVMAVPTIIYGAEQSDTDTPPTKTATIITVFNESMDIDISTKRYTANYIGDLDVKLLTQKLSEISGLDFTINSASVHGSTAKVDWSVNSTLVAGLDDREFKEGFHFFDVDTLNFFMMDSLMHTIRENFGVEEVFYTMDGGRSLNLPDFTYASWVSDATLPYMGSAFIYHHWDTRGDLSVDEAMDVLISSLGRSALEGKSIQYRNEESVDDDARYIFAVGIDSPEKFTVEHFYAVGRDSGLVYYVDIVNGGKHVLLNTDNPLTGR